MAESQRLVGVQNSTRRGFLKTATAICAALPAVHVVAADETHDKLNLAIIGVGGRGKANLGGVAGENIAALCDTNPAALAKAAERFPDAKKTSDWRTLMDDTTIDGVVISTADHHHALAAIAAMRADKHVYCEKPLAHTVREARIMQEEYKKRRGKIATQMGTQIHAQDNYRRVVELIQAGAIGPVKEAHVWCSRTIKSIATPVLPAEAIPEGFDWNSWLGPAADRPYNTGYWKGGNLNWNRRWEFGNGVLGDMGSHLIDLPFWALGLKHPLSVVSEGPSVDEFTCPAWQQVTWQHPARQGNANWEVPTKVVWYHGPEGMKRRAEYLQPLVGEDTQINKWGIGVAFVGEKGVLVADYGRNVLSPNADFAEYQRPEATIAKSLGHHQEWLHAAKTGGESLCNFDYSGALIEHNLLGNVAHRAGTQLQWNAELCQVENAPAANELLTKEYREGWAVADSSDAEGSKSAQARINGSGPGWVSLGKDDFVRVNSAEDTWEFREAGLIHCTGKPVSVMRTQKQYTNFELVCEWRHLKDAGNSGIFVWTIPGSLERLKGPGLPHGIEVQVLDLGYKASYEKGGKRKADWFTCHGDVFPVGAAKMTPFPPVAPNGRRSFPTKNLTKDTNEWNHYYVRAINGEVRLWVNGEEVSGGTGCAPSTGYLCLESEGSPVQFRGLRLRELP